MKGGALLESALPLPLVRRGKVREVYSVEEDTLLIVASDRVSALDVVMGEAVPKKGAVLTQMSAFWFQKLCNIVDSHFLTASTGEIIDRLPALREFEDVVTGRSMLVRRTHPVQFECVVRGYLAGSAWKEYEAAGTLAGEKLPEGLLESSILEPPIFSPATKATSGHDENVPFSAVAHELGVELAQQLRQLSLDLYGAAQPWARERGVIIADTKFEFGLTDSRRIFLIDEVLTPDSSRFWPADEYSPGRSQTSFDKQPLRDYLSELTMRGDWNGSPPPPALPQKIVDAMSDRYQEAFLRITGQRLEDVL